MTLMDEAYILFLLFCTLMLLSRIRVFSLPLQIIKVSSLWVLILLSLEQGTSLALSVEAGGCLFNALSDIQHELLKCLCDLVLIFA